MRTTAQPHGVQHEFDNGYVLSVINDWAAMGEPECPYEFMAWGNGKKTEAVGYQTKEDIDKIISMFEENNTELIDKFFDNYPPYEYCCPEPPEDDSFDCYCPEPPEDQDSYRWEDDNDTYDKLPDLEYDPLLPSAVVVTSTTRQHSFENEAIIYFDWKFVIIDCSTGVAIEDSSYRGQYKGEYDSYSDSTDYYGHRCPSSKKLQYIARQAGYNLLNTITI